MNRGDHCGVIRITSVPRSGHPNSGLQAMHFARKLGDEVWAIPEVGAPLPAGYPVKLSLLDRQWAKRLLPIRAIRALFVCEVLIRSVLRPSAMYFVHSFIFAAPLFALRRKYCIFIHGSDRRHLHRSWARLVAKAARRVFGVGFGMEDNGLIVQDVPNLFSPAPPRASSERRHDAIFVLRNAPVKNPLYPLHLAKNVSEEKLALCVVGIEEGELSGQDLQELTRIRESGHVIDYLGRCSYETVLDVMAASGLLIIPSHSEGVPKVMLEALSQGMRVMMNKLIDPPAELRCCVDLVDLDDWNRIAEIVKAERDAPRSPERIEKVMHYLSESEKRLHAFQMAVLSTSKTIVRG